MSLKLNGFILAGAMATDLISSAAYAAPALPTQGPRVGGSSVDKVAYRCWWAYGERHCADFYDGGRRIYRRGSADDYRTGSRGWWREMEREDRTGRPGR